eukprot:ctg_552.g251
MRRGEARWLSCACRACRVVNTALRDTRWGLPCVALSLNERQRAHLGEQARRVRSRKRLYIHNIRHSTRQRRRDRSPIFVVTGAGLEAVCTGVGAGATDAHSAGAWSVARILRGARGDPPASEPQERKLAGPNASERANERAI